MGRTGESNEISFKSIPVRFCGVEHYKNPSAGYLKLFDQIAALGDNLTEVYAEVPVYKGSRATRNVSTKPLKVSRRLNTLLESSGCTGIGCKLTWTVLFVRDGGDH